MLMKPLQELTRLNIWSLKPYSSARDEYKGVAASVFLDANENPYYRPYNRYPDPLQVSLKTELSRIKEVPSEAIFLGNGSDEAIDLVFRTFCEPAVDNVVAIDPTYGMYEVCADINNVAYRKVRLDEHFQFSADEMLAAADDHTKVMFLCSPNNPTGNALRRTEIEKLLRGFEGLVVVDEAYIDFADEPSFAQQLAEYPNMIVLQTFSKAWGCAAIRLGMAFASTDIIALFNKVKYPYNVNQLTQEHALSRLQRANEVKRCVEIVRNERDRLIERFSQLPCCVQIYPTNANFFLARVTDARAIYDYLVRNGIIVRNRTHITLCHNCLRITIGTYDENIALIEVLRAYKEGGNA